jgi:glycerophosphoryl diester phosphodiesterase
LKGGPGHDEGLVARVGEILSRYKGPAAIMSFDHWLIRRFPHDAPGIPGGLTAYGKRDNEIEAHFSMLANGLSFISYAAGDLPNRFVGFVREKLAMPVITWTVHDQPAVDLTFAHADQMTFEGFEPPLSRPPFSRMA